MIENEIDGDAQSCEKVTVYEGKENVMGSKESKEKRKIRQLSEIQRLNNTD